MLITLARDRRGSTTATIHRRDGVVLELPGFDRKYRVPHDLAHAVTERELALPRGVFGSIAGGAVFGNMRVLAGRPRHDDAARSRRLLAANKRDIAVAEMMAAAVHQAVEHQADAVAGARRFWTSRNTEPFPWPDDRIRQAVRALTARAADYTRAGTVTFAWPDDLTSEVPAAATHARGRRGRA